MHFKEWCLSVYGISTITEGKVIDRVFLPAIPKNRPYLDILMQSYGGYITTHEGVEGLSITKESYNNVLLQLKFQFQHINQGYFDAKAFEIYINHYFARLGFNAPAQTQFRTPPNIHLRVVNESHKQYLLQNFAHMGAKKSYDPISKAESVEVSSSLLSHLLACYYRSSSAPKGSLKMLQAQKTRLEKLLQQMRKHSMSKSLDLAKNLALDYDNTGRIMDVEYCSAYALSLRTYAELHRYAMPKEDYDLFYAVAARLSAYDRDGNLLQSLKSNIIFMDYVKTDVYQKYLIEHSLPRGTPIAELPEDIRSKIYAAINQNAEDLLYGNPDSNLDGKATFSAARFLPDDKGNSDTDEVILDSGGMATHMSNFRLIKVGVLENGEQANPLEIPHHYEYFKVENNLGANCHTIDSTAKTCWGTYVTRIIPCTYSDDRGFEHMPINPYSDPGEYQKVMESTLKMLISTEHQLKFYRRNGDHTLSSRRSDPQSKEGVEWRRLFHANQVLSGIPYRKPLQYLTQNAFNPLMKQVSQVQNERGYFQEGGSCPIFSLKCLVDSILGHERTTLHLNFMQENDAGGYISALSNKIAQLDQKIKDFSPLKIIGTLDVIEHRFEAFKAYLVDQGIRNYSSIPFSVDSNKAEFILATPLLKKCWQEFAKTLSEPKVSPQVASNSNSFFALPEGHPKIKILPRIAIAAERLSTPVGSYS
ncbi:hypothetical protein BN59_01664 [Legionella massiliensis]|uniref:Uncharacterized protein n=1 Tax=Legionella massiliensis TaxID=1034943 RepID=A0A078KWM1_9GAMM|nr:hypothetical protein [Legionella massiliensis]CDZ77381.1 hypothetical protein BN59_01664 [Legionella massiliensis]CEE13119.1 hypothetical protein BN1094_01664 [Legionella massiliensis]